MNIGDWNAFTSIVRNSPSGHLGYAIISFSKLNHGNPSEGVQKKNREDRKNIGGWKAFTSSNC